MTDQRGFFTIIGLCFLLAVSVIVRQIQETQAVYNSVAIDFQAEQELQNAADSALLLAVEKVKNNPDLVPDVYQPFRQNRQYQIPISYSPPAKFLKDIEVKVWGERGKICTEPGKYSRVGSSNKDGVILISVASAKSRIDDKKIYRNRLANIKTETDLSEEIFFMSVIE